MNISNTISFEHTYSKSNNSELDIKQEPIKPVKISNEASNKNNFKDKLDLLDEKDKMQEIEKYIDQTNRKLIGYDRKLDISIHEKSREVMIKILDTVTDEVIREIPAEAMLDNLAVRREITGILLNKTI